MGIPGPRREPCGGRDLGVAFQAPPGSQASSRGVAKDSALLSSRDATRTNLVMGSVEGDIYWIYGGANTEHAALGTWGGALGVVHRER